MEDIKVEVLLNILSAPQSLFKKSKTPQGIEPRPDRVRSAITGVFCFLFLLVRAKAKPGRTKQFVLPGKENPTPGC